MVMLFPEPAEASPPAVWSRIRSRFARELDWLEGSLRTTIDGAEPPVSDAILQLLEPGGKRVRPLLSWLAAAAVDGATADAHPAALTAELVHTATLLHDDVLDDGAVRRGVPAARILHGNRISVMAGDFVLTRALGVVVENGSGELLSSFSRCVQQIIQGEVRQQRESFRPDVDEATYREIVALKTGALFAWAAENGARLAHGSPESIAACGRFGMAAGIAFQILDDWLDWSGDATVVGKSVRADLKEGKPSLAMIYGCQESPWIRSWYERHLSRTAPPPDEERIAWVAGELESSGALARVVDALYREQERALAELSNLPPSPGVRDIEIFAELVLSCGPRL